MSARTLNSLPLSLCILILLWLPASVSYDNSRNDNVRLLSVFRIMITVLLILLAGRRVRSRSWSATSFWDLLIAFLASLCRYWGQDSSGNQKNLSYYCQDDSVDVIPLAFLYVFFGEGGDPMIDFSNVCRSLSPWNTLADKNYVSYIRYVMSARMVSFRGHSSPTVRFLLPRSKSAKAAGR